MAMYPIYKPMFLIILIIVLTYMDLDLQLNIGSSSKLQEVLASQVPPCLNSQRLISMCHSNTKGTVEVRMPES
jgi:hypothetical protein